MSPLASWRERLRRLVGDAELARASPGLDVTVAFVSGDERLEFTVRDGRIGPASGVAEVTVVAAEADWMRTLEAPAPPACHAFTAWEIANPAFAVEGDPALLARARAALERVVEKALEPGDRSSAVRHRHNRSGLTGRWHDIDLAVGAAEIFCEHAGTEPYGRPILFLHTAGADARQFSAQLADAELAVAYRMFAPDMPFHGRSLPPDDWDGGRYKLTADTYVDWCTAIIEQVIGERVLLVGGSMGAAIALVLAGRRPDLVLGAVAVEPPFRSEGRRSAFQNHVAIHAGLHNSAFVRGLMSPTGPERARRDAAWIYSQGAPGIYPGDLAFYSEEFDGARVAPEIDATRTPIALLSGEYDFSATPADGARLAELIPGARHDVMDELGHFPMIENPAAFRPYLIAALDHVCSLDPSPRTDS